MQTDYGYQFDDESSARLRDYVDPSMPLYKATVDGVAWVPMPDEMGGTRMAKCTIEMKCTKPENSADEEDYDVVADMHVFQKHAQLMLAKSAEEDIEFGVVVYYDYNKAILRPHVLESNESIQKMIKGGYHLAVNHIDSKVFPHLYEKPCLLYTSPSPRDKRQSRMPSSA